MQVEWGREFKKYASVEEFIELEGMADSFHTSIAVYMITSHCIDRIAMDFMQTQGRFCFQISRFVTQITMLYLSSVSSNSSMVAGVGHCPMDEAPHLVNPLVQKFIERHTANLVPV